MPSRSLELITDRLKMPLQKLITQTNETMFEVSRTMANCKHAKCSSYRISASLPWLNELEAWCVTNYEAADVRAFEELLVSNGIDNSPVLREVELKLT